MIRLLAFMSRPMMIWTTVNYPHSTVSSKYDLAYYLDLVLSPENLKKK